MMVSRYRPCTYDFVMGIEDNFSRDQDYNELCLDTSVKLRG